MLRAPFQNGTPPPAGQQKYYNSHFCKIETNTNLWCLVNEHTLFSLDKFYSPSSPIFKALQHMYVCVCNPSTCDKEVLRILMWPAGPAI